VQLTAWVNLRRVDNTPSGDRPVDNGGSHLLLVGSDSREGLSPEQQIGLNGGGPAEGGSVTGSVHRGWMGLKAALTGEDEHAILGECERGEDSALAAYRAALGVDLPASVRSMVERQFAEVEEAHQRIRNLDRATDAGA
jgi:uncharacterized protein (TIGR02284 family)